jgi:hypothetical protein
MSREKRSMREELIPFNIEGIYRCGGILVVVEISIFIDPEIVLQPQSLPRVAKVVFILRNLAPLCDLSGFIEIFRTQTQPRVPLFIETNAG